MVPHSTDKTLKVNVEGLAVDYNFIKTMGIKILQGREFSQDFGSDLKQSIIVNESAVKQLGLTDPLAQKIGGQDIIGVVKDFNLHSIHSGIPALTIHMTDEYINQVAVHYKPGTLKSILPFLEAEWKKAVPDRPFTCISIEDMIRNIYSQEKNLSLIVSISSLFTLVIAAFGLFGLTLFVARSRMKEIGIRKVFGSSGSSIVYSFLWSNLVLVFIAILISIPVTVYFMTRWLNSYAYNTGINWIFFVISFLIAAAVVLLTVFFHSWKASGINPVVAIRNE